MARISSLLIEMRAQPKWRRLVFFSIPAAIGWMNSL
jgi:hypothetical protein